MDYLSVFWVLLQLLLISGLWKLFNVLIWRPYTITKRFERQGIRGPTWSLIKGSLEEIKKLKMMARETVLDVHTHDIIPRVLPHYHTWFTQYGDTFLYWYGAQPRICISEPELANEVFSNKFGFYRKPELRPSIKALLGGGLVFVEGQDWVRHRRAVNPAFNIDKLKMMTKSIAECTLAMLNGWQEQVMQGKERGKEVEMDSEIRKVTADVISHTAFGTSYIEGKEVFEVQLELLQRAIASRTDLFIPGSRYLPTKWNIRTWTLDRIMNNKLRDIILRRLKSKDGGGSETGFGDDLLGVMMGTYITEVHGKKEGVKLKMDEIMAECKTFFFAGHEALSRLLTWTILLLSLNREWQEKLREEVVRECGMGIPDADKLGKLKLVNMVLLETLRLYSPALVLFRNVSKETKLGDMSIPEGTEISLPLAIIHRKKKYWGEDADEFNPMRFVDGVAKAAKHPNAFVAFATGPRACIGQNFAMMEGKMVMAMILQRFSFSLSPKYKHAPTDHMTLKPQFGLPILLKPLQP